VLGWCVSVKFWVVLFALFVFIAPAYAAQAKYSLTVEGDGSLIINNGESWSAGYLGTGAMPTGKQYNGGSSGDHLVSGPGSFQYQDSSDTDARVNDRYTQSGYSQFHNGVLFDNTLYMQDSSANVSDQYASTRFGGYLTESEIQTAKFVNNANMSSGQEVQWAGPGIYEGEITYGVELDSGGNTTVGYENGGRKFFSFVTNQTGWGHARPEYSHTDFSDTFIFSASDEVNNTSEEA